jgi:hypothetical protein
MFISWRNLLLDLVCFMLDCFGCVSMYSGSWGSVSVEEREMKTLQMYTYVTSEWYFLSQCVVLLEIGFGNELSN